MTTRYANLLIDAADRLAQANGPEQAWLAVNAVAGKIGANGVNAGAFLRDNSQIAWMRSSMDPLWLADYAVQRFHEIDPLLQAAMSGAPPSVYDVSYEAKVNIDVPRIRALHDALPHYDANYFVAHSWFEGGIGKGVTLSCLDDPRGLFGPGTARAFASISAMMSCALQPPGAEPHQGYAFGSDWSHLDGRERAVLSYLANGMREDEIAEKMVLRELAVWAIIQEACRKMRAETRDQTLALAITRGQLAL
ncbi:helix-turn-helix transcriptional regulator [Roseivivax sp. CAU 1761]